MLLTHRRPTTPNEFVKVYESEVKEHTLTPEWRQFCIPLLELCSGDYLLPLLIKCFDWNKNGNSDLIGEFHVDLLSLVLGREKSNNTDKKWALINPKKVGKKDYTDSGKLVTRVRVLSTYELAKNGLILLENICLRAPFLKPLSITSTGGSSGSSDTSPSPLS